MSLQNGNGRDVKCWFLSPSALTPNSPGKRLSQFGHLHLLPKHPFKFLLGKITIYMARVVQLCHVPQTLRFQKNAFPYAFLFFSPQRHVEATCEKRKQKRCARCQAARGTAGYFPATPRLTRAQNLQVLDTVDSAIKPTERERGELTKSLPSESFLLLSSTPHSTSCTLALSTGRPFWMRGRNNRRIG